ncbi:MAG: mycothiol system anti-sigma-R factor [Armatimonadetes bacterium]|nr:mycothiol system anti-sigma-R factor [Armatimonadota bacterium]
MSEVDCNVVLERLWAFLDGETDEASCRELEAHIEACLHCRNHADFERRLRAVIQAKCRDERAPLALRAALDRLLSGSQ